MNETRRQETRLPLCNHEPLTAPRWGSRVFCLCWRCTGIGVGVVVGSFSGRCLGLDYSDWIAVAAACALFVDWTLRNQGPVRNPRRFVSGALFGFFGANAIVGWGF